MSNRPSVYISYAHSDGMEFVRRLAFALSLYVDVYWDRRVQTGEYPDQMGAEIERCDYFVWVTTPYSLTSEWCKQELAYAHTYGKAIALAHIYSGAGTTDPELDRRFTFGDFTENFEFGFRTLTTMILGQPYSSWESFSGAPTPVLLNYLKAGVIPAAITKQVSEQLLVQKLWSAVTDELGAKKAAKVFFTAPLTASGLLTQSKALSDQFEKLKDKRHIDLMKQAIALVETCVNQLLPLSDDQHAAAGQIAHDMLMQTKSLIETKQMADRDFDKLHVTKSFFEFDVAERIRAAIAEQVRRSRALY